MVIFEKMNNKDIQGLKLEIVKEILQTESEELLNKLYVALKSEQKDFWLDLSEAQKKEVEIGLEQVKSGKTIELEDFLKKVS